MTVGLRCVGAAFLYALLVTACGDGGGDGAATTTTLAPPPVDVDPCSLTTDEAIAALSEQIETSGITDEVSGPHTCAWRNINGVAVVTLRVGSVATSSLAEELARVGLAGDRFVEVAGVAEEAVAVFRSAPGLGQRERLDAVFARNGDQVVVLGVPGLDIVADDRVFDLVVALTRGAAASL